MTQFFASSKAGDAPDVEPGLADALFVGVEAKRIKGGQYTKDTENGDPKIEWLFKLLDDDGRVLRNENEDSESFGKPIIVTKLTSTSFNTAAKTVPGGIRILKALLTPAEFAAFENGEGTPDAEVESPEGLLNRKCQVEVQINDNGWPYVGNVLAARKPRKSKSSDED